MAQGIDLAQAHRDDCETQAVDAYEQSVTTSGATGRDADREQTAALIAALAYRCVGSGMNVEEVIAAFRRQVEVARANLHRGQAACIGEMLVRPNFPLLT